MIDICPCKDCICLPICRSLVVGHNSTVEILRHKCTLLNKYIKYTMDTRIFSKKLLEVKKYVRYTMP